MARPTIEQVKQYGFVFPQGRMWITPENKAAIAQDAALITTPNTTVPVELTAYIDPMVVEIMTAPRNAREIFGEEKKGDWTTPYMKWRTAEYTGKSEPYNDFANGTTSRVNNTWQNREQYLFQTTGYYGDLEVAMSTIAKVNFAADVQRSCATTLDIDANKFYLLGVQGKNVYGILNDPNLPAAITAAATGTGGATQWNKKNTQQIYDDIRALFNQLASQSNGLVNTATPLKLCVSPQMNVMLGAATDFNVSVLDMIKKFFTQIDIVVLPELHSMTAGETVFMIAPEVAGQKTGVLAYGEKMRAGRLVMNLSSCEQKFVGTTYGGIVLQPFAFAQMTGM